MAITAAIFVFILPQLLSKLPANVFAKNNAVSLILLLVIVLFQIPNVQGYPEHIENMAGNSRAPMIEYVIQNTKEDDKVLIIGAESVVNFLARREAPTRYVYQYPLALLGRRPMFEEYFKQILENKPVLIIDTRGQDALTDKLYTPLQKRSQIVKDGVQYLGEHYRQVTQIGEWFVYRLIESP
jgi:hypothetical protein